MSREDLEHYVMYETLAEILHQYLSSERTRKELGWKPGACSIRRSRTSASS